MYLFFLIYYLISICKFYISFKICKQIRLVYFQNLLSEIVVLTERENADVTDTDVVVDWML
jgi:hypothetical protein